MYKLQAAVIDRRYKGQISRYCRFATPAKHENTNFSEQDITRLPEVMAFGSYAIR